ncbi:MAG: choice-of-anchor D domain-containing protein, partial [Methylococcaceae bacterium]
MKSKTKETQVVSIESQSSVSWNFRAVIGLALGVGLASQGVNASTFTWNGGSGSGSKFSSRSNWNGTAPPTYSSANIFQFAGTTRLSPVNDLGTLLLLGIEFNSGAGAFTLTDANTSNSITLGGSGITNNSANTQTVNNKLKLSAAQTFNNTLTGGTLAVGGTVNLQTYTLTLDGSNAIDLSGVISGSGALVKNGTGTTTLSGANTYTGATTINAGTLALGASNGLANTGTINITGGTLNVNGKTETIANLNLTSGAFINGGGTLTVGTDYNNTGFGTGNTFNKSAGVTTTAINSSATNAATQQTLTVGTGTANNGSTASTMVFGNLHVGQTSAAQTYTIGNAGNAGSSTLRGAVKNDGTLDTRLSGTGIATGGSDWSAVAGANNGAKTVTFTASTAGALSETLTVLNNFSNTISQQTLNISGAAYDFAKMTAISPITLANQRLGGTAIQALSVTNGAATGLYSEKLDATITASSSPIIASGSAISGLAAGATNNSNFTVGVDTATAGAKSGIAAIRLVSNGTGTSGLANTTLAAQNVTVSGNVYRTASGSTAATVNLGAQHVGGLASQALTVSNNSINDSYSEKLDAIFGTATGAISTSGIASLIGAGSNSTAMSVGVNTTSAGAKTGNVSVNFSSDGTGTSGLATIGAGTQNVAVSGNVYNYA